MSFIDRFIDKGKSLLGIEHKPTEEFVIQADRFDRALYQDMLKASPNLEKLVDELSRKNDYVDPFVEDIFQSAFKTDPVRNDAAAMRPDHLPNHTMIETLVKSPQFEALRANTRGDEYCAAMATLSMKDAITEAQVKMREAKERAEEAQKAADEAAKEAAEQGQQMGPEPDPNGEPGGPGQGNAGAALAQAQANAQQAQQNAQAASQQAAAGMAKSMKAAADQASEDLEEEAGLMAAFGIEDGELKRMSFEERAELARRLRSNRLAKFYKLLGQFKMVQQSESRRKVQHAADEVVGVKLGDNLQRLIPAEMLNLATPELEDDFWVRWANGALLEYDLRGSEKLGQGPVIVVCDESGSMEYNQLAGGTAEAWSKALALALCDQARQKGRDFHYIGFSSGRQQWTKTFVGGKTDVPGVIEMTEHFWNGGTNFEEPLRQALDLIEKSYDDHGKPKPDIVFITDDDYSAMDEGFMAEWNRVKDKTSVRCFGIALCVGGTSGAIEQVSDNVRSLNDVTDSDPRVMADLFRTI